MMNDWRLSTALATIGALWMSSAAYAVDINPDTELDIAKKAAVKPTDINPDEYLNLSIEQLSNLEVTSVSKKSEKANEAAAAIFVITPDDIKRSGATSIPEVLRIVPGLDVARSGAHNWAISSRGFNDQFANKLLVLIDGRSVYTPLFSGVFWQVQDTLLDDIERIEVIRGPGATLWGANAVNGVINIITKSAKNTQGGLASATAGTLENAQLGGRYGYKLADNAYMRTYAKYDDYAETRSTNGGGANDNWNKAQSGFRADWKSGDRDEYTVQGDIYRTGEDATLNLPNAFSGTPTLTTPMQDREFSKGGNLLGRWSRKESDTSRTSLQLYLDNMQYDTFLFNDNRNTFDLDFQHAWTPDTRNEIVYGAGYRLVSDQLIGNSYIILTPQSRNYNLVSAFLQDKIGIIKDKVFLTLGSKFEHNDYTGFELQPSARATWLVDNKQTLWASVSHAVRTPNRFSDDGSLILTALAPGGPPSIYLASAPNNKLNSEELNAYEAGYRIQPTKKLSFDIATYYNDYSKIVGNSIGTVPNFVIDPVLGPVLLFPVTPVNNNSGRTYGAELVANWDVTSTWQLTGSYTYLNFKLDRPEAPGFTISGKNPRNQFNIRSSLQLGHNVELDNSLYYVSRLAGIGVDSYYRFDTRLAWKPMENLELSLVGQNLLDSRHQEFSPFIYQNASEIPRSVYGNITWKF